MTAMNNLAMVCKDMEEHPEAEQLLRDALTGREAALGEGHRDTLASLNNLASLLQSLGRNEEAEPLCRRALECCRTYLGEAHADTKTALGNLVVLLCSLSKDSEAMKLVADRVTGLQEPNKIKAAAPCQIM